MILVLKNQNHHTSHHNNHIQLKNKINSLKNYNCLACYGKAYVMIKLFFKFNDLIKIKIQIKEMKGINEKINSFFFSMKPSEELLHV